MNQEILNIIIWILALSNLISSILNLKDLIRYRKQYRSLFTKIGVLKKELLESQQQLVFYKSRCYGSEKKAELLEDELTKLKIKK